VLHHRFCRECVDLAVKTDDIHVLRGAGRKRRAPQWMREHGFEWFFRLMQDPRRLWRRYLIYNSQFIYFLFLELFKLKRFE
jgi:UDP-N-acetyl-D-mannosaminuronic acid transferase (WecB/TagA/CpsF family)